MTLCVLLQWLTLTRPNYLTSSGLISKERITSQKKQNLPSMNHEMPWCCALTTKQRSKVIPVSYASSPRYNWPTDHYLSPCLSPDRKGNMSSSTFVTMTEIIMAKLSIWTQMTAMHPSQLLCSSMNSAHAASVPFIRNLTTSPKKSSFKTGWQRIANLVLQQSETKEPPTFLPRGTLQDLVSRRFPL